MAVADIRHRNNTGDNGNQADTEPDISKGGEQRKPISFLQIHTHLKTGQSGQGIRTVLIIRTGCHWICEAVARLIGQTDLGAAFNLHFPDQRLQGAGTDVDDDESLLTGEIRHPLHQ
ncbi:hypothetical protein D3C81_1824440 [compost metagenome]